MFKKIVLSVVCCLIALPCMAEPPVKFTVAEGKGFMSAPYCVALKFGYFADEGQSVRMKYYPKGHLGQEDYLQGKTDMVTNNRVCLCLGDIDPTEHAVIGVLSYNTNNTSILGRRDRGIVDPASLRGKTIGTSYGTTSHFWVFKWLAQYGLGPDDVTLKFFKKNKLSEVIAKGEVDALCIGSVIWEKAAKNLGDNAIVFSDSDIDLKQVPLMVPRSLIRDNRAAVLDHLRVLIRAEEYINAHPREAAAIVAKMKKLKFDEIVGQFENSVEFHLSLRQGLLTDMEAIDRWAIENKLVERTQPQNYLDFIDYTLLDEIDPDRVTIIR